MEKYLQYNSFETRMRKNILTSDSSCLRKILFSFYKFIKTFSGFFRSPKITVLARRGV